MKYRLIFLLAMLPLFPLHAQDYLTSGFDNPPAANRPRVWWHWMNGNITKEGIRKDLLWMEGAGIVGFHNFDAGMDVPQVVEKRLPYMTPEWKDAFSYMLDLADSLGMEVSIASSPGWSCTGGPWVKKENAMKKLVWTVEEVTGGWNRTALPVPPEVCGFYLDIPMYAGDPHRYDFYEDIAVIAVKVPERDLTMQQMGVTVAASDGTSPWGLCDGSLAATCSVAPDRNGYAWVLYQFPEPQEIRSFTCAWSAGEKNRFGRVLEYSDDGIHYTTVIDSLPLTNTPVKTFDFAPVRARYFRFRSTVKDQNLDYSELELSAVTRVSMTAEKSGFYASAAIVDNYPTPPADDAAAEVLDLTDKCHDGCLEWTAPEGRWRIYRFGYNLTGKQNGPASPEAVGLEVDKFDSAAVQDYYRTYLEMYRDASGDRLGSVIKYIMIDSYEAKCQTWCRDMEEQFKARRGYDLRPWLPALAGVVLQSSERTERFLADWRLTLSELLTERHYDSVDAVLKEYGMGRHTESHGYKRTFVSDGMDLKRHADIPMSEFWVRSDCHSSDFISEADIRESSSVCHIYGQKVCATESFTADGPKMWSPLKRAWSHHPGSLKPVADGAMASGVNRFIIHTSVHQPIDTVGPGMGLGNHGLWFTRHETWAGEAREWTDYLARSTFMLSQGEYVADIAYYFGETTNVQGRFMAERPYIPRGYAYDFVNRTALLEALDPHDGILEAVATGMQYRVLVIDNEAWYMSLEVLRRIRDVAEAGVLIVGEEPVTYTNCNGDSSEFISLVQDIWHSGRPNVVSFEDMVPTMLERGTVRDVDIPEMDSADIRYIHRRIPDGEMYWIANLTPEYRTLEASFHVSGLKPQIWHADTGVIEDASYRIEGDRTTVRLDMTPDDSQFIVFRGQATELSDWKEPRQLSAFAVIDGPWKVTFQQERGAPESSVMYTLSSLSDSAIPGIRYFSGTATYTNAFHLDSRPHGRVVLDLGKVADMARVLINGKDVGLAWKEPYRLDVTDALRKGENTVEVRVTNTWVNRTVGDEQQDCPRRITFVPYHEYSASDPLLPSGLLGPVRLLK